MTSETNKASDNLKVVKDDMVSFEDYKELQNAIEDMDALSQEGFYQIIAISRLILKSLEMPRNDLEDIAYAVETIKGKAQEVMGCINSAAENVGCHYSNHESSRKRYEAFRQSCKDDALNLSQQ
ncbi:hypothetical protein W03_22220 [Nitrosomonas sp. PY1]|uniref:hypothetical protein n=1 Tax=Nitrosomonas sp. PY1 TaxID=1803906 RepID=UPI001FC82109|nr:hypothetical protein [Nitrosomonas sp. PY1]GKS70218.1 hypothetical protein W03_22220 [Nitrosomonas sp. PY1]